MRPLLAVFFEKAEDARESGHGTQTMTEVRHEDPDADVLADGYALDTQTVTKVRHEDPDQDFTAEQPTINAGTMTSTLTREDSDADPDPGEAGTQTGTRAREEPDTDIFDWDSSNMWEAALL